MPKTPDPWLDYRRRRRRLLVIAAAGLVLLGLSFLPAHALHSAKPVFFALALFIGATSWASVSLSDFPCPHCGKPFIHNRDFRDGFTRECVHCQHPKWSGSLYS
jgi:hypothetical protein